MSETEKQKVIFGVDVCILCANVSCTEITVLKQNELASLVFLGKKMLTDAVSKGYLLIQ